MHLASYYINTEHLGSDQKRNILKNVSVKSDQDYLKFWIYNGRGDLKQALSLAKHIGDDQLALYIDLKLLKKVNADSSLTAEQKRSQIIKYQKSITYYLKKLKGSATDLGK
ncbi:type VII secretion protein EssB/YukC [Lacticaseibacillus zeae]|uniref:type VII secretion protein EssB/YukC n=1 Tax=Lacticaseibacillus zeae TaxID=57037 RepID=UPI003D34ECF3